MDKSYFYPQNFNWTWLPRGNHETDVYIHDKIEMNKYCDFFDLGDKSPDFTLPAIVNGLPSDISLSSYKGKWVVIFFYSSDFTFV